MVELQTRKLHPEFGVEVIGLEPRVPLDPQTIDALRKLFDDESLLLFRGLDADVAFQAYLSYALIGMEPPARGATPIMDPEREYFVSNKEPGGGAPFGRLLYHSDLMWREDAFQVLSLYGVEVEEPSLPTMFVSTAHGWESLPDDLRARVEGRFAEHGQDASYQQRSGGEDDEVLTSKFAVDERVKLPIGHRHPRTGRTLLYVCQQMTHGIADLPQGEVLLEELFQHLYAPERVFEHHWRKGDLVIWDNLALQHARPNVKAEGPARTLRKTFAPIPQMMATQRPVFGRREA
jgi:alpha-ketoglutarate-dependent taurine dioxygenase